MDEATTRSLKIWDSLAAGWDRTRKWINTREQPITNRLHAAMNARPGNTILELCAGPGEVGLEFAAVHPDVKVIISDFSPSMVKLAANAAKQRGLKNVETKAIDAQSIELDTASIDGVLSRCGLMLVPDPTSAFSEVRRVLKTGGTLAYTTWPTPQDNPWMMIFGAALIQLGHFTPPEGGSWMALSTEQENAEIARSAGFADVSVDVIDFPMQYESVNSYFEISAEVSGPLAVIVQTLSEDQRNEVRAAIDQLVAPFKVGERLVFPSSRLFVEAA